MTVLYAIREVQIPLVAAMLLGACAAKLTTALRTGSAEEGLGPTMLFPLRLRRPLATAMWVMECGLGIGMIVTAGKLGEGPPATCVRLGSGLLFLVATSALIELRAERPEAGCGCFGDFSTAPVSSRTIARSAFLALAALSTIGLKPPIAAPASVAAAIRLVLIFAVEIAVIGALSPELGEGLIRLGYTEPCELREVPNGRTLALLRRSRQWRQYSGLITADVPLDVWRELCWRYVVYQARYQERETEIVFAVFLRHRRPAVHAALVDAGTGLPVPALLAPPGPGPYRRRADPPSPTARPVSAGLPAGLTAAGSAAPQPDMPFSSDL